MDKSLSGNLQRKKISYYFLIKKEKKIQIGKFHAKIHNKNISKTQALHLGKKRMLIL